MLKLFSSDFLKCFIILWIRVSLMPVAKALPSADGKTLERVKTVMETVYGSYTGPNWVPKNFTEKQPRYLWSDSYGVVNFLTLYCETKNEKYLNQAKILIRVVHDTLGKTRDGWKRLPGATDDHPTLGGLRIGKPEDEGPDISEDGQYYHYLTKWMFALNRASLVTKDPRYNRWAIEMAKAVHKNFVQKVDGKAKTIFWKMNINMTKPLSDFDSVRDSIDGYSMYRILQEASDDKSILKNEIADLKYKVDGFYPNYTTSGDPLGIGLSLWLVSWYPKEEWSRHIYSVAKEAVNKLKSSGQFESSQFKRYAFREFGAIIGVQMHKELMLAGWAEFINQLHEFWYKHLYESDSHVTPIMYCTSMIPGLFNPGYKTE